MRALDRDTLRRFVELAGDRLAGDWVVLGGCVLHLLGIGRRTTLGIDVAGPLDAGMDQALVLMEIAEELGLPVESVNTAGAYFLRRIDSWERLRVPVHRGATATLHVPNATLFLLLKIGRLTEADLADCLHVLDHARERREAIDGDRVAEAANRVLSGATSPGHRARIDALLGALRPASS